MKTLLSGATLGLILAYCPSVFSQVPENPAEAQEVFRLLIKAYKGGQWPVFSGLAIMLLVFAFNKLQISKQIEKKYIPWVSVVLGLLTTVGTALIADVPLEMALLQGLTTGTAAIGFWELLFKHILRGKL